MEDIIRFKEDPTIKGVILRINSPGGGVGPTQEIFREVMKLKEKKKVYVSMGTTCASGGYYIASAGEKLYANPSTITGSIGVIMQLMIVEDVLKKIGLQSNTHQGGRIQGRGVAFQGDDSGRKGVYGQYSPEHLRAVHEGHCRGEEDGPGEVKKLAEGKIYTGNRAKDAGPHRRHRKFLRHGRCAQDELQIKGKPVP